MSGPHEMNYLSGAGRFLRERQGAVTKRFSDASIPKASVREVYPSKDPRREALNEVETFQGLSTMIRLDNATLQDPACHGCE